MSGLSSARSATVSTARVSPRRTSATVALMTSRTAIALAAVALSCPALARGQAFDSRGQLYSDGCYYITLVNPVIPAGQPGYTSLSRQGCRVRGAAGTVFYVDDRTHIWRDEATGYQYGYNAQGVWMIFTDRGWTPFPGSQIVAPPPASGTAQQQPAAQSAGSVGWVQGPSRKPDCVDDPYTPECKQKRRDTNGYDCFGRDINTDVCKNKEFNKKMDDNREARAAAERQLEAQRAAAAAQSAAAERSREAARAADRAMERRREEARRYP